eukprot:12405339-Karenia_brevis.AAC.1
MISFHSAIPACEKGCSASMCRIGSMKGHRERFFAQCDQFQCGHPSWREGDAVAAYGAKVSQGGRGR